MCSGIATLILFEDNEMCIFLVQPDHEYTHQDPDNS